MVLLCRDKPPEIKCNPKLEQWLRYVLDIIDFKTFNKVMKQALMQAVFHVSERFWVPIRTQKIKKQFFSKISSIP